MNWPAPEIDGCSDLDVFTRIYLPLARPGGATITIFQFVHIWNEFLFATTFIPIDEIARCAATALLDRIEGRDLSDESETAGPTVMFAPTLVCRESTAPPPHPRDATALSQD